MGQPAAGGGRRVEVSPERIGRWLSGFAERHGGLESAGTGPDLVRLVAADGALAECQVPFPPLAWPEPVGGAAPAGAGDAPVDRPAAVAEALARHACRSRRVGVLLARLGGYAAGVFDGTDLVASKVGSRLVHGRSAAGGQSQARFARRRANQARKALLAAADTATALLGPYAAAAAPGGVPLAALVCGGDRTAIQTLRQDRRLAAVFALETGPFLTVPDPRLAVLRESPRLFRAVRVRVVEPPG